MGDASTDGEECVAVDIGAVMQRLQDAARLIARKAPHVLVAMTEATETAALALSSVRDPTEH